MDEDKKILIKKTGRKLSYLLRHDPEDLNMDSKGWVFVTDLLDKLSISKTLLDFIVMTNDKQRYSYNEDETKIRANQGHSLKVDVELKKKVPPIVLYHGTSEKACKIIMKKGLDKMRRNHVHLSKDVETAEDVGSRHSSSPIILVIDCEEMVKDGFDFYLSDNGVWLTDHVPAKYINQWD